MHVKNPQSALLSNHEVYQHIRSASDYYLSKERNRDKTLSNVREILQDGLRYFEGDPNAAADTAQWTNPAKETADYHPERPMTLYKGPHSLLRALAPKYRLNKAEYLQLYNVRPTSRITLELIIEEATSRFSEEELDDILQQVLNVFYEEEASIPAGVENQEMEKLPDEMLGDSRRKHKKKQRRRA
ncbi:uncharacterized protein CC84DRAFT_1129717 [Paraphaeosphaeria sporulosa]|uniref:DNA-directed RNA polymerase III subunit RPC9 n=1 Tax=Paraphaeosphaeria sporulosa TaxID=1460663 RepID=A0A177BZP8_9PLEO|nr:uncharacterized protein CC84DRAFT_1129717 [Paraphaeosphaeria sporulosa]OAF99916.1 hypothetical protein CC84DRAFT_1129717 [Paraphaeosphaeria sporulosa]